MTKPIPIFLIADKEDCLDLNNPIYLKDNPASFLHVTSAADCLKTVMQRNVQVVVVDENLPDLSGLTLVSLLKKMKPDVEIIFTTQNHDAQKEIDARLAGILYYAVKPIDWTLVGQIIDRTLKKQNKKFLITNRTH